jgi:hypothetical protein
MQAITESVMRQITIHGGPSKVLGKVTRYLSELIMRCLSNHCWDHKKDEKIYLKDAFFLIPLDKELDFFYDDVNYSMKKVDKRCTLFLKRDELGVKEMFMDAYERMKNSDPVPDHRFEVKYYSNTVFFDIYPCFQDNDLYTEREENGIFHILTKTLNIPIKEYERLESTWTGSDKRKMETCILLALIRYQTLNSGAHQFILDLNYKKRVNETFGADFECFGSVFNRTYTHFCSLFYDLEKDFGSHGNFMALTIKSGYFQANPPYEEVLMRRMYIKAVEAISSDGPVVYTLSLPQRPNYPLKERVDDEKLFLCTMEKEEKFHVPCQRDKMIPIPPYNFYIFTNIKDVEVTKKLMDDAT